MIEVKATVRGPLADAYLSDRIVQKAVKHELIQAIGARMSRYGVRGSGGKGKGVAHNRVSTDEKFSEVTVTSTLINPRTTGAAWRRKNIAIVKSMTPRVINATCRRIEAELG